MKNDSSGLIQASDIWHLASGIWHLASGIWHLAHIEASAIQQTNFHELAAYSNSKSP
ncbi:hypothetical protein [Pseudovibrio sp. JE062]|uniref:hypothetical protein n=1 Tax=Pseudovibrio sp. JE062 TaxID=439495 RepID=UPI0012EE2106|nr:hypothetical protein [Pseudovibrio sp. JE062]